MVETTGLVYLIYGNITEQRKCKTSPTKKKKKGKDKKSGIGSQEPRKKGTHALSIGSHFRFGILQCHPVAHFSYQHNIQQNLQIVMVGLSKSRIFIMCT